MNLGSVIIDQLLLFMNHMIEIRRCTAGEGLGAFSAHAVETRDRMGMNDDSSCARCCEEDLTMCFPASWMFQLPALMRNTVRGTETGEVFPYSWIVKEVCRRMRYKMHTR